MFAAIPGSVAGLPILHTYLSTVAGGIFGAAVFFFMAEFFMIAQHNKTKRKRQAAVQNGLVFKEKKKFTKMNRFIVKIKMKLGIYGVCFWAPFFLSVPIGSIVAAKFYGKSHRAFPLICLGMAINGCVTTGIAYLFN